MSCLLPCMFQCSQIIHIQNEFETAASRHFTFHFISIKQPIHRNRQYKSMSVQFANGARCNISTKIHLISCNANLNLGANRVDNDQSIISPFSRLFSHFNSRTISVFSFRFVQRNIPRQFSFLVWVKQCSWFYAQVIKSFCCAFNEHAEMKLDDRLMFFLCNNNIQVYSNDHTNSTTQQNTTEKTC